LADRLCANNGELSYVAVSRARALLVVVGPVTGTKLGEALRTGRCEVAVG
jgi:ATP-dependent exoDNAse (exonuclease V) alpha subunit